MARYRPITGRSSRWHGTAQLPDVAHDGTVPPSYPFLQVVYRLLSSGRARGGGTQFANSAPPVHTVTIWLAGERAHSEPRPPRAHETVDSHVSCSVRVQLCHVCPPLYGTSLRGTRAEHCGRSNVAEGRKGRAWGRETTGDAKETNVIVVRLAVITSATAQTACCLTGSCLLTRSYISCLHGRTDHCSSLSIPLGRELHLWP
jgi:hypothetical protein